MLYFIVWWRIFFQNKYFTLRHLPLKILDLCLNLWIKLHFNSCKRHSLHETDASWLIFLSADAPASLATPPQTDQRWVQTGLFQKRAFCQWPTAVSDCATSGRPISCRHVWTGAEIPNEVKRTNYCVTLILSCKVLPNFAIDHLTMNVPQPNCGNKAWEKMVL